MADFASSTQKSNWLLSEEVVTARREKAHTAAVEEASARTDAPPMSLDEALELLDHHERRTAALSRHCGLPEKVASSAVIYFRRFFVDRSLMQHNPSVIALQALYAASKVEEAIISSDDLVARADSYLNERGGEDAPKYPYDGPSGDGTAARVRVEALLNGELDFLQALRFQLVVFHPYRSLHIAANRLKPVLRDDYDRAFNRATELCATRVLHSDLVFSQPPAVLAAAAALAAVREISPDAVDGALDVLAGDAAADNAAARRERISALADRVATLSKSSVSVPRLAELELKRLAVRDEAADPTSELFRKREAEEEEEVDKERRMAVKKKLDAEKEAAQRFLMGESGSATGKRSRADAGLDDREPNENSPVRKRLNLGEV